MLPQWFWRVRFRMHDSVGETLVVAPHRAAAKKSVAQGVETITVYESAVPGRRVSDRMATQSFAGYYPGVRAALDTGRETVADIRGD